MKTKFVKFMRWLGFVPASDSSLAIAVNPKFKSGDFVYSTADQGWMRVARTYIYPPRIVYDFYGHHAEIDERLLSFSETACIEQRAKDERYGDETNMGAGVGYCYIDGKHTLYIGNPDDRNGVKISARQANRLLHLMDDLLNAKNFTPTDREPIPDRHTDGTISWASIIIPNNHHRPAQPANHPSPHAKEL